MKQNAHFGATYRMTQVFQRMAGALLLAVAGCGQQGNPVAERSESQTPAADRVAPSDTLETGGAPTETKTPKHNDPRLQEGLFYRMPDLFLSADAPRAVPADQAHFLRDTDEVLGFVVDGHPRAYSVRALAYHHAINDRVGNAYLTVTY